MVSADRDDLERRTGAAEWQHEPLSTSPELPARDGRVDHGVARRDIVRDVVATFFVFAAFGTVAGSWFSRIPALRDQLDADLRTLGFVLLCFSVGSLLSMPFSGHLIERFSLRRVSLIASTSGFLLVPTIGLIGDAVPFAAVLLLAGMSFGVWNVTINVHGAAVEPRFGRAILPAFHGAGSGGILLGSAVGALLAGAAVAPALHFAMVTPLCLVIVLVATRFWIDWGRTKPTAMPEYGAVTRESGPAARRRRSTQSAGRRRSTLTRPVLLIGLLAFCCALIEGATSDWLAIHAHDEKGLTEALAAAVYTTYALAVTIGRFAGGTVIDRIGRVRTIRICGPVIAGGVAAAITLPGGGVFLGAALWGVGLSVMQPLAVTVASELGGADAPRTVATVSTMSWTAFLVGPPAIGMLAHQFSLGSALWTFVGLAVIVSLLAGAAAPSRRPAVT